MGPTDFLQYPQYFSLLMIWASGYIFVYSIFRKSRAWKEFDSTIKLVVTLVAGFSIEFCLVLPVFFAINIRNWATPFFPQLFDATWPYNWLLTGVVALLFLNVKDREFVLNTMHQAFQKVILWLFLLWLIVLFTLAIEFFSYPSYIMNSSGYFPGYLAVNVVFSGLGLFFCYLFGFFTRSICDEEKIYGGRGYTFWAGKKYLSESDERLILFFTQLKYRIFRFSKSNRRFAIAIIGLICIGMVLPLDSAFTIFTPKINYSVNLNDPAKQYYMSINLQFQGYNEKPYVWSNFSMTYLDTLEVVSPQFDIFGNVTYPLPPQCSQQYTTIGYYPLGQGLLWTPYGVYVYYDNSLANKLIVNPVPSIYNSTALNIYYNAIKEQKFSLNLTYWENTDVNSIIVSPSEVNQANFNDTFKSVTQDFTVINHSSQKVFLYQLWLLKEDFRGGYPAIMRTIQ